MKVGKLKGTSPEKFDATGSIFVLHLDLGCPVSAHHLPSGILVVENSYVVGDPLVADVDSGNVLGDIGCPSAQQVLAV